ncbi:RNA-binding cell elongation regulator Jag/EloR [Sporosarcina sp. Te-1]|uniref:RNA-binding cell elongation regulator Jag/EloR n=1 Tax=Sporosarcina sp. Te-1 TaxID=2818390 RepID=UPI001A9CD0B9|nr:RNA-binding cell elongation regulator Jag/EloR [Sporosarcina sp. Te-1]QTD40174.1 protein jag [Sporosarcina sp. Te-1]
MNKVARKGASVELAIEAALRELGVTRDQVEIEVVNPGKKGFLGIGARDAEVVVTLKSEEAAESMPESVVAETVTMQEETKPVEQMKEPVEPISIEIEVSAEDKELSKKLSDDKAIEETKEYLLAIAKDMGIHDLKIEHENDGKYISFHLESTKAAFLIGKRGQTLNSLQQLCQLVVNKYAEQFKVIRLDVGDYRERREQSLEQLAERMADQAIRTGRKVQLEPMPSYERKVIHNALSNRLDIETYSEGTDPNRYLVIEPMK